MAAIGNYSLALVSAEQRTTLAAANLNLDFTLIKLPPPEEYKNFGRAISETRQKDAEDGSSHVVARKLAALFTQDADFPKVPNLIKAYGVRASEISQNSTCNPRGSPQYGAFADHIGLDGTSVWAAATSGKGAIPIHLLACMLSTMWTGPEATAIWQEILLARRAILQNRIQGPEFQLSDVTAAQIQISREQLALWDTSARAWCRTADEACAFRQHQLRLIAQGFAKALHSSSDLYVTIKRVWYKAMVTLDYLISGVPQNVQEPEVLLGLLAWHIYPDMEIIGETVRSVYLKDALVAQGGIITLGMISNPKSESNGISWSLPLSRLRYYGEPVVGTASIENTASRISFEEMMFVALGGLTKTWFDKMDKAEESLLFLVALRRFFERSAISVDWIRAFGTAAELLLETKGEAREEAMRLLAHGRRKCAFFTTAEGPKFPAAFGLKSRATQFKLLKKTAEGRLAWLREQLPKSFPSGFPVEESIIMYRPDDIDQIKTIHDRRAHETSPSVHNHVQHPDEGSSKSLILEEFATLCPVPESSAIEGSKMIHRRWIAANESDSVSAATVPGFHDVLTASAQRCHQIDARNESCSLYTPSELSLTYPQQNSPYSMREMMFSFISLPPVRHDVTQFRLAFDTKNPPRKPIQTTSSQWAGLVRALNPSFRAAKFSLDSAERSRRQDQLKPRPASNTTPSARNPPIPSRVVVPAGNNGATHKKDKQPSSLTDLLATFPHETEAQKSAEYSRTVRGKDKPPCLQQRPLEKDRFQFNTNTNQYGCPHKWYIPTQTEHRVWQFFYHSFGDFSDMVVCSPASDGIRPKMFASKLSHVTDLLASDSFDHIALHQYLGPSFLKKNFPAHLTSLEAISMASGVYSGLQDAKVPISAAAMPLHKYGWARSLSPSVGRAYSCIAMFETGGSGVDIDPGQLEGVMAISTGDSLYMAEALFLDPVKHLSGWGVRRAIGNIGRPGLAFLVSPVGPKISKVDDDSWQSLKHDDYDGRTENNFAKTTLHLSFTGSELPISSGDLGMYDKEVYFLEAVIGAFDRGRWVADVDILLNMKNRGDIRQPDCGHHVKEQIDYSTIGSLTSIDSWEELIDIPDNACVVRAHKNWLARLAIASVVMQKQRHCLIVAEHICWRCLIDTRPPSNFVLLH